MGSSTWSRMMRVHLEDTLGIAREIRGRSYEFEALYGLGRTRLATRRPVGQWP
jgi:hypothetical protein